MSRNSLQTVTLPVLLQTGDAADGALAQGACLSNVRIVRANEVGSAAVRAADRALFAGLSLLKSAYEVSDELGLEDAMDILRPHLATLPGVVEEPPDKLWARARWDYTALINPKIAGARLVTWWTPKKKRGLIISPAVLCPDLKTAAFVMEYLSAVRVCPKCKTPFVPQSDNVRFCSPAHGAAHRTARSRRRAKDVTRARDI